MKKKILAFLLLGLTCFFVFGKTINYDFVWDDLAFNIKDQVSLQNYRFYWIKPVHGMYAPVTYTFWAIIRFIGRGIFIPSFLHFFNIFIHLLNSFLIFLFLCRKSSYFVALLCSLFFVVHPIQVEVVAYISELKTLLCFFFGISGLYMLGKRLDSESISNSSKYFLLVLFILSILCKPHGIVFLCFIILLYPRRLKELLLLIIALGISNLATVLLTKETQIIFVKTYPLLVRIYGWADTIIFYLYKIAFPIENMPAYSRTYTFLLDKWWFFTTPAIVTLILVYLISKKNWKLLRWISLFIASILPVSGLIPFSFQGWSNVADRYAYFAMFIIVVGISYLLKKSIKEYKYLFIILIITFTMKSFFVQVSIWRVPYSLWSYTSKCNPQESKALYNKGAVLHNLGMVDDAETSFKKALEYSKNKPSLYYILSKIEFERKQYEKALDYILIADSYIRTQNYKHEKHRNIYTLQAEIWNKLGYKKKANESIEVMNSFEWTDE